MASTSLSAPTVPRTFAELLRQVQHVLVTGRREVDDAWVRTYDRYLADVFVTPAGTNGDAPKEMFVNNELLSHGHAETKNAWEFGDWDKDFLK